jgi:hypothetical protein
LQTGKISKEERNNAKSGMQRKNREFLLYSGGKAEIRGFFDTPSS